MLAMLNLLPSVAADRLKAALAKWEADGEIEIVEPCNCGSHVRHNNGGNYHSIITLTRDSGRVFVKLDDTCELTDDAYWEEVTESEAVGIISKNSDWL